jgi:uncharacterized protein (DUF362 family)
VALALLWTIMLLSLTSRAADADTQFAVSVVPSDDLTLESPSSRDDSLSTAQVEQMVRRAVDLIGGMQSIVSDTARLVVLKVNIGLPWEKRSGAITDDRVARGVAILVHEAAPDARILIAEAAGGWSLPEHRESSPLPLWDDAWVDGFERAGHRATVEKLRARGADIDVIDLNFDEAYTLHPPDGGLATDTYDIAASILDADVWINVPVAKTHGAKITCCMKNHFGILPGRLYGFSKSTGTDDHPPMPHSARIVDEAFIDLWRLTQVDLNVVDMISGTERGPFTEHTHRMNIVMAGRDPVATDLVVAKLMGFNPDDLETADLAWQHGLGPRWLENVDVRGGDPTALSQRWVKGWYWYGEGSEWREHSMYGKGPRRWTLLGPVPKNHLFEDAQLEALSPTPGADDWSPTVWFGHDKIDLDDYYNDPVRCAVYGYTEFTMPQADSVHYWMGADERLQVWIDGQPIYDTQDDPAMGRRRRHELGMVRLSGYLEAGDHRLLIRADQNRGRFEFSFNVVEPIYDERFAGNTYPGLRYHPAGEDAPIETHVTSSDDDDNNLEGALVAAIGDLPQIAHPDQQAHINGDTIIVDGVGVDNADDLATVLAAAAGIEAPTAGLAWVGRNPFSMVPIGPQRYLDLSLSNDYRQEIHFEQIAQYLDVRYELSAGFGHAETFESIDAWMRLGHAPVTGADGGNWTILSGLRPRQDDVPEIRIVEPAEEGWYAIPSDWWAHLPGIGHARNPVVVALAQESTEASWVARSAHLILESARARTTTIDVFGDQHDVLVGLAAWDFSVLHWERLSLTLDWAREGLNWSLLARTRSDHLPTLIADRRHAARVIDKLASGDEHEAALKRAAAAYSQVADLLQQFSDLLPDNPRHQPTQADASTLDALRHNQGLMRRARAAERDALQILSQIAGEGPLPPLLVDPLSRLDKGHRLITSRYGWAEQIWEIALQGESIDATPLHASYGEESEFEQLAPLPTEPGWIVAVEIEAGTVTATVIEQPTAENDWEARIRFDNLGATWQGDEVAFTIWAIPVKALIEGGRP